MQDYNYQKGNGTKSYDSFNEMQEVFERFEMIDKTLLYLLSKIDNIERILIKMDGEK